MPGEPPNGRYCGPTNVPVPDPRKSWNELPLATIRSRLPSPSRSVGTVTPASAKVFFADWNAPPPLPRNRLKEKLVLLDATRSGRPSLLKSPTATEIVPVPAV